MERLSNELEVATSRLTSLTDGERGVLEVVRIGTQAIPRLRTLLFQREPSGLFQSRCHVVEALAALNARTVLAEFLQADRNIPDPVERAGEEAVINAAARAVRDSMDEALFHRLLLLAGTRKLIGPIEVVGDTRRIEALSGLIAALGDDLAHPVAEEALRKFGGAAATALIEAASTRVEPEHESARRRRRAAMRLLNEIDPPPATTENLRLRWRRDPDIEIALLGCRMALKQGNTTECDKAVEQLIQMLGRADWRARREIKAILSHSAYSECVNDVLAQAARVCQGADRPSPKGAAR
jgi:hypothetical protein